MADAALFVERLLWCKELVVKAQKDLASANNDARTCFRLATQHLRKSE